MSEEDSILKGIKNQLKHSIKTFTIKSKEDLFNFSQKLTDTMTEKRDEERRAKKVEINPAVRKRDKDACCFCKKNIYKVADAHGEKITKTIHHKRPIRYGGEDIEANMITICFKCHERLEKYIMVVEREAIRRTLKYVVSNLTGILKWTEKQ